MSTHHSSDSRFYKNNYPDYFPEDDFKNNNHIKDEFISKVNKYILDKTKILINHCLEDKTTDVSIYTGRTGIAFALLMINDYLIKYMPEKSEKIKNTIKNLIPNYIEIKMSKSIYYLSFLCGSCGPLCVLSLIYKQLNDESKSKNYAHSVIMFKSQMNSPLFQDQPDEILYGRAGYLYSLLFLKFHKLISVENQLLDNIANDIINSGLNESKFSNPKLPLKYSWHDSIYLGAAHGYIGIFYMLLDKRIRHLPSVSLNLDKILITVNIIFENIYPSGNLPSSLPIGKDRLVQWCHGAPGAIFLATRCYKVTNEEKYYDIAVRMADDVWKRGLLKKGPGLCHGIAGNAYSFLNLYNTKKDNRYLYYAFKFAEHILKNQDSYLNADRPFSLFEGLAGTLLFFLNLNEPSKTLFPCFQTPDD